jgi:ABC-type sugar transport system ATPase subunit
VRVKEEVHGLADLGNAALVGFSDMREIVLLADRIAVMGNFRMLGENPERRGKDYDING